MGGFKADGLIFPGGRGSSQSSGKSFGKDSGKGKGYGKDSGRGYGKDYGYGKDSGKSYGSEAGRIYGKGSGRGHGKDHGKDSGKDSGSGSGNYPSKDSILGFLIREGKALHGRHGPSVYQRILDTIPANLSYTCEGGPRHAQLIPEQPSDYPELEDIFGDQVLHSDSDIVSYPRYLSEPYFEWPRGHRIFLSRIPWQSSCRECPDPGLA